MARKKLLILSSDAGYGHRSAAMAVQSAFRRLYGDRADCALINPLDNEKVPKLLRRSQHDYDKIVRKWPELYRWGYQANDFAVTGRLLGSSLAIMLYEAMRQTIKQHQPDAIVTTFPFYLSPLHAHYTVKNRHIPLLTVITDLVSIHRIWFHRAADYCLVPTRQAAALALKHGWEAGKVRITGIPVNPQLAEPPPDRNELRRQLGWDETRPTVLMVGSKRVNRLAKFAHPLNHSGLPLQLAIVTGGDDEQYAQLQQTEWHLPVHLYNFVGNMPQLLQAADCVVCKAGGLMVTESLAAGRPLLIMEAIPGQETGNLEYVVEEGAGLHVRKPLALLEALYHWLADDGRLLHQFATHAHRLGQPAAAAKTAEISWEAVQIGPFPQRGRARPGENRDNPPPIR